MPFQNRFLTTTRGCITITGNTLGLSKNTNGSLTPGTADAVGGFITTNTSVPTATGWTSIVNLAKKENITLDWTLNSSSAQLNMLANSTVLYAELIWGGNYNLGNQTIQNVSTYINNSVKLTVPGGQTYNIPPDSATSYTANPYYSRSANVTPFITSSGTYTVGSVPAGLSISDTTGACVGWSLIVVYGNSSLPIRNMTVFAGGEVVSGETVDTTILGFATPVNGTVNARISVSSIEGDANRVGDYMQFGPSVSSPNFRKLFGPNNWASPPNSNDNFFNSQINIGDPNSASVGQVDTTGTFGNRNANASQATPTNITAGRQGWSITNVNGSSAMVNNQTSAIVRLATAGDVYIPNAFAVEIDSAYTIIGVQKNTPDTLISAGQPIHYTLTLTNTGTLATNDFLVYDPAPIGESIDVSSIVVSNNATGPVVNNSTSAELSIKIGPLLQNQTVTITYTIITNSQVVFPVQNTAYGQYTYIPASGVDPVTDTVQSTSVTTNGVRVSQSKSVSNSQVVSGDTITYSINIDNRASSVDITNVSLIDLLQSGTTYVNNSTVIGSTSGINADPNGGINIGTIPAYGTLDVSFDVLVTSPPVVSPIINTASITFTGAGSTKTQTTNTTSIDIVNPNMTVAKSVDKSLAQVGDTLTYTTVVTNTGDVPINNLIFSDPPPANTTYNGTGVTIDGILYTSINPSSPIDLLGVPVPLETFPLYPGENLTISYSVVITSVPLNNQISNTSSVTSQYRVGSQQRTMTKTSNTVTTNLFKLSLNKTVDRVAVEPGDLLTYTVTITSTTPGTYADDIIFIDNLSPNVTRVPGSTVATGATVIADNSTSTQINLNFGKVFPNNPIVITFTELIESGASGTLQNVSSVNIGTVLTNSNSVLTEIAKPSVTKSSSEFYVTVNQTYTYTVTVDNTESNVPLTDVYVYDDLQLGTSYVPYSTKIGSISNIDSDPSYLQGISIGTVDANTIVIVSFDVKVTSFPAQNPILNTATINYNLDSIPKSKISNQTEVTARLANVTINKSVDKQYADLGETITYTVITNNTGNVPADSVSIEDTIPTGTSFKIGSVTAKNEIGNLVDFTENLAGSLLQVELTNSIPAGGTVIITFQVIVGDTLPVINPITNTASVNYYYTVDPTKPPINPPKVYSSVITQIVTADLSSNFTKAVDKDFADVGDIITYTIAATNTGNTDANNVVIIDAIPVGTTFQVNSITSTLPYTPATNANIQTGITLTSPIIPGGSVIVTYKVKIDVIPNLNTPPDANTIINTADISYTYTVNPSNSNGASDSGVTNTVKTVVNNANIGNHGNFTKSVDKTLAVVNEIIKYTLKVSNTGSVKAEHIIITDIMPDGAEFQLGTVIIDGNPSTDNPETGISISEIGVGTTVTITYEVKIILLPDPNPMPNTASIIYDYAVDSTTIAYGSGTSNEVRTSVEDNNIFDSGNFTKTVDKQYANVYDILTYKINIHNSSGIIFANNVVVTDSTPNNTTFERIVEVIDTGTNLPVDYTGTNPNDGIIINDGIAPLQTIQITYEVKVSSLPSPNEIFNNATLTYTYVGGSGSAITNIVTTEVYRANLAITKRGNKNFAYVGDTITYYLSIINTGNTPANNVYIEDLLPDGTSFVAGSLILSNPHTIDPVTVLGITLTNSIQPNESIDISFQYRVDSIPNLNIISNYATVDYTYTVDPDHADEATGAATSETVETTVNFADLISPGNFTKEVDTENTDLESTITYKITVKNTGNIIAENVVITDEIPEGTTFFSVVSVTDLLGAPVDYAINSPITDVAIISINEGINFGAGVIITFKVFVVSIPPSNYVVNYASIDYDYVLDPTTDPKTTILASGTTNQTLTRVNDADLSSTFSKTVDKAYADVGDILTYTITTTNIGNIATLDTIDDTKKVIIKDIINSNTTIIPGTLFVTDGTGLDIEYDLVDPQLTLILKNPVDVGETVKVTFQVRVNSIPIPPSPGGDSEIINTASVTYTYEINPATGETDTDSKTSEATTIINSADLTTNLIKNVDKAYADVGDILTYKISTTNIGNTDATTVLIIDALQTGTTYVPNSITITDGSLNPLLYTGTVPSAGLRLTDPVIPGETIILTYKVTVTSVPIPNIISNTANLSYEYIVDTTKNTPVIDSGTTQPAETEVQNANLMSSYTKGVSTVNSGINYNLTYTLSATNNGSVEATSVVITDSIPTGTVYILGTLTVKDEDGNDLNYTPYPPNITTTININLTNPIAPGGSVIITYQVKITSIPPTSHVVNYASIDYDYNVAENTIHVNGTSNEVSTRVNDADLETNFTKTVNKEYADVGEILTYTITTTNIGNISTLNTTNDSYRVIIKDTLPSETSLISSSIIVKDGYGNTLDYKQDAPELTIILINPVGAGEGIIITYQVIVDTIPVLPSVNPIKNGAYITYSYYIDPTNKIIDTDSSIDNKKEAETTISNANLLVSKNVDLYYADINDELTYTITIINTGNTDANNVVITDPLPPGTNFVLGSLWSDVDVVGFSSAYTIAITSPIEPNATITVKYRVRVVSIPNPNTIINTADVGYTYTVDPSFKNAASNSKIAQSEITEVYNANLAAFGGYVNKTVNKQYADRGEILTYTIVATNTGNVDAENVVLMDTIPKGTTYVENSITVVNGDNNPVDFDATSPSNVQINVPIAPVETIRITFQVQVDENTIPSPNPMENIANLSYDYSVDPTQPNRSAELTSLPVLTLVDFANLTSEGNFTKDVDLKFADVGDILTYTLTIINTGNTSANNVVITDLIPPSTAYVPGSISSNVGIRVNTPFTRITIIDPIYSTDIVVIHYQVRVTQLPNPNVVKNIATINYYYTVNPSYPNGVRDSGETNAAETEIYTADLITNFTKTVDNEYAILGEPLTYTLTIENTGNVPAVNINIKDVFPEGLIFTGPITVKDNHDNMINFNGNIQDSGITLEGSLEPIDQTGYPIITITIPMQVQPNTIPEINPLINVARISYDYTVNPADENGAHGMGYSNQILTFIICETELMKECLLLLSERIKIYNINVLQSYVEATVVKTNLDRTKLVYKDYGPLTLKVSGYYLYVSINFKYFITYNKSETREFNEIDVIPIFIPLGMSNSTLYTYLTVKDTKFYIDGSGAGFYVTLNLTICVSDEYQG